MTEQILLPHAGGSLEPYAPGKHAVLEEWPGPPKSRIAYAAAHVVADPLAGVRVQPNMPAGVLDWEAAGVSRRTCGWLGFGLPEAVDASQRGMQLTGRGEPQKRLVRAPRRRSPWLLGQIGLRRRDRPPATAGATLEDVKTAYKERCEFVEGEEGRVILMASRALAAVARRQRTMRGSTAVFSRRSRTP